MRRLVDVLAVAALGVVLVFALLPSEADAAAGAQGAPGIRERVLAEGEEQTGAANLVTAIYLGYRAYDTLGETVVLLLAVTGVVVLIRRTG